MSKIKTLGKFMKNPLKYAANQASCVSKGKKLGLSSSDARNACKPHYLWKLENQIKEKEIQKKMF